MPCFTGVCVCVCITFVVVLSDEKPLLQRTRAICLLHITFNYYCIKQRQGFLSLNRCEWIYSFIHSLTHSPARSRTSTYNKKQTSNQMFKQKITQQQQPQLMRRKKRRRKKPKICASRTCWCYILSIDTSNVTQCNDISENISKFQVLVGIGWGRISVYFLLLYESEYIGG